MLNERARSTMGAGPIAELGDLKSSHPRLGSQPVWRLAFKRACSKF